MVRRSLSGRHVKDAFCTQCQRRWEPCHIEIKEGPAEALTKEDGMSTSDCFTRFSFFYSFSNLCNNLGSQISKMILAQGLTGPSRNHVRRSRTSSSQQFLCLFPPLKHNCSLQGPNFFCIISLFLFSFFLSLALSLRVSLSTLSLLFLSLFFLFLHFFLCWVALFLRVCFWDFASLPISLSFSLSLYLPLSLSLLYLGVLHAESSCLSITAAGAHLYWGLLVSPGYMLS